MFDKTAGAFQNIAGRIQEAVGSLTDDASTQIKGRARRVAGGALYGYGEFADRMRESAVRNPVGTFAVIAGAFFILGAICTRR